MFYIVHQSVVFSPCFCFKKDVFSFTCDRIHNLTLKYINKTLTFTIPRLSTLGFVSNEHATKATLHKRVHWTIALLRRTDKHVLFSAKLKYNKVVPYYFDDMNNLVLSQKCLKR